MYIEKIKEIRKKLGLSVPKLSERINIPVRTIVSYEGGRTPSLEFVTRLCNELNINANWFISGKGEMFNAAQNEQSDDAITQKVYEILRQEGVIK
jgi:transcriptional regulator with XRE-family HTH domain